MANDKACVVAFHLAVLEAIELSRKHGCHEVTLYQTGVGEYGSVNTRYAPPGAKIVCRISAGPVSVLERLAPKRTWTAITFTCEGCGKVARASQDAIDSMREGSDDERTDAEIVAEWQYCLSCCAGKPVEGEHVEGDAGEDADEFEDCCPVGDPDCLSKDDESHEACEAPDEIGGIRVSRNSDAELGGTPSIDVGGWTITLDDLNAAVNEFGSYTVGAYEFNGEQIDRMKAMFAEVAESRS